jgi:predicted TIM-barrel fold metal-dependent hydrolase
VVAYFDHEKNSQAQLQQFDALFSEGKIVGIKLYPGYNHFYSSDLFIDPVARLCARHKRPLIIHTGDVLDEEANSPAHLKYSHPIYVDELASRNRDTTIVMAHFGFPYFLEAANVMSKNHNVYADLSGTLDDMGKREWNQAMMRAYIADLKRVFAYFPNIMEKALFGSDFGGDHMSLNLFEPYVKTVKAVFPRSLHESVFSGLAKKLFFS